jgi:uncharacterized protein (TIGR02001 family)
MMKMTKSVIAAAVLAATSTAAMAEVSMNVGATSNYLWRGITQSEDGAAVSGGVDYSHESGIYVGLWASSLGAGTISTYGSELDYYAGWAGEFSGVGVDVGYVSYTYPEMDSDEINADFGFSEVYLGASYSMFSAKYSYDSDNENSYIEAGADIPLPQDYTLGLHAGSYDMDVADDYTDYSVSLSKGDITMTYSDMSENLIYNGTDNARIAISWSQSF